jgi:AbrB family looped-hinge helix DNA binding protein
MPTETARLTRKHQTTIPSRVRKALDLHAGELVAFDVEGTEVRLRKATPVDLHFAGALAETLSEWGTEADEEAYRDL